MADRRTIEDVEVVLIPLTDYAGLLADRQELAKLRVGKQIFQRPTKSPIERDPEVAIFLSERLGKLPMRQILADCALRFGRERTPSKTALGSYWSRLRIEARSNGL